MNALPPEVSDALFDRLFDLPVSEPSGGAAAALERYRTAMGTTNGEIWGALSVPAAMVDDLIENAATSDHALPVLLSGERAEVRAARDLLADNDRFEIVGVHLAPDTTADPATATEHLLAALDFTVPTWIELRSDLPWPPALRAIVEDGVERACLALSCEGADALSGAAELLAAMVYEGLPFRLHGPSPMATDESGIGWLNTILAVHAATKGAAVDDLADLLGRRHADSLWQAASSLDVADAGAVRRLLAAATPATDPGEQISAS